MLSNEQVISIATELLNLDEFILAVLEDVEDEEWLDQYSEELNDNDRKMIALMMHTDELYEDLSDDDYLVLDDAEAEEAMEDYATNYCDDIILPEIPQHLQYYFDSDSWIADFINDADRGECLSTDLYEYAFEVLGTTYYIYAK